ncbi:unnamed protein product, partial [Symbiodinium microadriaticum]
DQGKALTSGSPLPIDEAVESLKDAPEVSFALMPRAHGSGNVPPPPKPPADPDAPDSMTRAKRRAADPATPSGGKSTGKGLDIPSGAKTRDAQGRPVCFRYNRKACDQSKEKCSRGYHVCWFCLKNHAGVDHKGQHLPGRILDPTRGPCFLASHRLHFTLPWQGHRVVLVAFSPWYKGQDFDFSQLAALGFRVRSSPPRCLPQHVELLGHRLLLPPTSLRAVSFDCEASEALALEVFCGRGRLSVALRDPGLSVLPVDHRVRCNELQVVRLDLTDANDISVFLEMLCTANVCVAHFGPPCGTASRTRERPLPPELAHIASPPLRSDASPFGVQGLTASQAARVRSANLLYVVTLVSVWAVVNVLRVGPAHLAFHRTSVLQKMMARFPIVQGPKVRIIDDCLQSGLNSAYAAYNKLRLMDADAFISLVLLIIKCARRPGSKLVLDSGEVLEVKRHPGWGDGLDLLGKTLDLASTYKQLGCKPETTFNRVLVAWCPEKQQPAFFISTALMFGATSAVFSFNRCSASLWYLAVSMGSVCCTVYFDDFPCAEPSASSGSAQDFLVGLLSTCLGWQADQGILTVRNKPDRVKELRADLSRLLEQGFITRAEASSLHGRLNFAQGQLHGCPIKPALRFLSMVASQGWDDSRSDDFKLVVGYIAACFAADVPREIHALDDRFAIKLFTDGAWDDGVAGAGAVLQSTAGGAPLVAEIQVPEPLLSHWAREGRVQLISQLELFPVLVALATWGPDFAGRRIICFIDNNGVRDALIKGSSPLSDNFVMLSMIAWVSRQYQLTLWFTRVASESNPADKPSRARAGEAAKELGGVLVEPLCLEQRLVDSLLSRRTFLDQCHCSLPFSAVENVGSEIWQ